MTHPWLLLLAGLCALNLAVFWPGNAVVIVEWWRGLWS